MGKIQPSAKYLKFIVYLVVLVLVNAAGATLFFRLDLTENKAYSLSDASKQVVSNLSEPLTIKVFFSRNLPAPHNGTERYLRDLLEEYAAAANRNFNFLFYNVSSDSGDVSAQAEGNQKVAENYGIHPVQIQAVEQDEVKFQKAYMGLVLIHGDIIEKIPALTAIDGLEYRLTTAIRKLNNKVSALLGLKEKIRIRLYLSPSLETVAPLMGIEPLEEIPDRIKAVVEKLNGKNYGKLDFEYVDPERQMGPDELAAKVEAHNLLEMRWPAVPEKNLAAGSGVSGLVLTYGEKAVTIPLIQVMRLPIIGTQYSLTEMDAIEAVIDGNIASLIDIHEELGVLNGYGTPNISGMAPPAPNQQPDDVRSLRALAGQNYSIKGVRLTDGIPGGIQCLLIASPTEKFSDYDLFQIDQFLMQGKNLALFLDPFQEIMSPPMMGQQRPPQYLPVETGLEKLLAHYGVRMKPAYVLDENSFKQQVPEQMGGGQQKIYFAPLIQNRFIDKEKPFMHNIKGLIALKNAPLVLDDDRVAAGGIHARHLFASSDQSWEMGEPINLNPMFISPPAADTPMSSLPLAYLLEGEFSSYFAGKPVPEKPVAADAEKTADGTAEASSAEEKPAAPSFPKVQEQGAVIEKGKPGKILLVGSSEMLKDTILSEDGRGPNAIFVMNALDYLNNREDTAVMRSKEQSFNPLAQTDPVLRTVVKALNIGGLPVLVVLFGLLVWNRRHARRRRIQATFLN